jgi:hypothetical protein
LTVVNSAGTEVFRGLLDGARPDRFVEGHLITEWSDVWLRYTAVNEVGAAQGEHGVSISEMGQVTSFEQRPWYQPLDIVVDFTSNPYVTNRAHISMTQFAYNR